MLKLLPSILLLAAADSDLSPGGGGAAAADAAAAEKAAAEEKAAADKAEAAKWKGKTYAEIAAEHVRLQAAGQFDQADVFHRKFVRTFKDK